MAKLTHSESAALHTFCDELRIACNRVTLSTADINGEYMLRALFSLAITLINNPENPPDLEPLHDILTDEIEKIKAGEPTPFCSRVVRVM